MVLQLRTGARSVIRRSVYYFSVSFVPLNSPESCGNMKLQLVQ